MFSEESFFQYIELSLHYRNIFIIKKDNYKLFTNKKHMEDALSAALFVF